jgi:hypothetical protein
MPTVETKTHTVRGRGVADRLGLDAGGVRRIAAIVVAFCETSPASAKEMAVRALGIVASLRDNGYVGTAVSDTHVDDEGTDDDVFDNTTVVADACRGAPICGGTTRSRRRRVRSGRRTATATFRDRRRTEVVHDWRSTGSGSCAMLVARRRCVASERPASRNACARSISMRRSSSASTFS